MYGETRHPTDIERDTTRTKTWEELTGSRPSSSAEQSEEEFHETNPRSSRPPDLTPSESSGEDSGEEGSTSSGADSQDEVEKSLSTLAKNGGVRNLSALLATAVPLASDVPDTRKPREWSFKDIMRLPPAQQKGWLDACRQELDSLRARSVYDLVDSPKGRKVIRNRWVFDEKTDGRKRARLVAKGFSQVEGIDYEDIFSPIVRYETVRIMIALAALSKWHMRSVDVKTAFLYGELDEELYMEQPEGFKVKGQERKVFRLRKAIYGLKQAALQWWRALDKSMNKLGFRRLKSDSGIFVLIGRTGPSVIAIVYVDDAIFMGPDLRLVDMTKAKFMSIWECRDLGETKEFL